MQTELWSQFGGLIAGPPRYLAVVHAHNADGTSSVSTWEGGTMRALGQLSQTPPYNAWIQDGRVVDAGPNLPLVSLNV